MKMKRSNFSFNQVLLLYLITDIPLTTNSPAVSPLIVSDPLEISKPRGDTAQFHCKVKHLGDRLIVWRRGYDVLATGPNVVSADPRVSVEKHSGINILNIRDIGEQDAGEYVCQISIPNDILSVQHSLNVLVPPTVVATPPEGHIRVKEGEEVNLQCEVSGNPLPSVVWSKQDGILPQSAHKTCPKDSCLTLASVHRDDSGVYTCSADNGVGQPDTASITLTVEYSPMIKVDEENIPSGPGNRVSINCQVSGEPTPSVNWFFADRQIHASAPEISIKQTFGTHTLVLNDVTNASFGNYSCVARNNLGTYKKYIEVHGRPTSAVFHTKAMVPGKTSYELSWEVESFVTIQEYRLLYRRIEMKSGTRIKVEAGSDWTNVIIPGDDHKHYSSKQTMRWRLDNLLPDTTYECLVQARNKYGWSQASRMYTFQTVLHTIKSAATQGLNWSTNGCGQNIVHVFLLVLSCLMICQRF